MKTDIHPIFAHMFANMAGIGLLPANDPASVTDLQAERVRREREASERRHAERNAKGDAA